MLYWLVSLHNSGASDVQKNNKVILSAEKDNIYELPGIWSALFQHVLL